VINQLVYRIDLLFLSFTRTNASYVLLRTSCWCKSRCSALASGSVDATEVTVRWVSGGRSVIQLWAYHTLKEGGGNFVRLLCKLWSTVKYKKYTQT